jgi:hypothetical protein
MFRDSPPSRTAWSASKFLSISSVEIDHVAVQKTVEYQHILARECAPEIAVYDQPAHCRRQFLLIVFSGSEFGDAGLVPKTAKQSWLTQQAPPHLSK